MFEIIALIFLSKKNAGLALKKGLAPGTWVLLTVLTWIVAEFTGILIGFALYGKTELVIVLVIGLMSGFGGYLIIRRILELKPDVPEQQDSISRVSVDDLKPPKK